MPGKESVLNAAAKTGGVAVGRASRAVRTVNEPTIPNLGKPQTTKIVNGLKVIS